MTTMAASEQDGDIREQAVRYLTGELSREAFEEWFVAATWESRRSLAAKVDHLLAEAEVLGIRFDVELEALVTTVYQFFPEAPATLMSITTTSMVTQEAEPLIGFPTVTITGRLPAFAGR